MSDVRHCEPNIFVLRLLGLLARCAPPESRRGLDGGTRCNKLPLQRSVWANFPAPVGQIKTLKRERHLSSSFTMELLTSGIILYMHNNRQTIQRT